MGKNNQQRRAAKQRKRAASAGRASRWSPSGPSSSRPAHDRALYDGPDAGELVAAALLDAAHDVAAGDATAAANCAEALLGPSSPLAVPGVQQVAAAVLTGRLGDLWRGGWQPRDVVEITRRRLDPACQSLLVAVLAEESARYARSTLDARWVDQLAECGADARRGGAAPVADWQRSVLPPQAGLSAVVELLGLWATLGALPLLMPAPGTARSTDRRSAVRPQDERALARVRALLAKAEATDFPEEAEALSAKAQELMARHSLQRLVVDAVTDDREPVTARRLWVDAPYPAAKALLIHAVAEANRCRTVWAEQLGLVTVIGDERDLTATELLVTSLLVQATRAMVDRGRQADRRSRSRGFRQSFLVAYATRVGERLKGATDAVTDEVVDRDLLPVLIADGERLEAARAAMFPSTVRRSVGASDAVGWAAGRAAADLARLDAQAALSDRQREAS